MHPYSKADFCCGILSVAVKAFHSSVMKLDWALSAVIEISRRT